MTDALEEHKETVSICGRTLTNLRFAADIDGLAGSEQELENLVKASRQILHNLRHGNQCKQNKIDDEQRNRIEQASGPYEDLLSTIKRRKLIWFGHVIRGGGLQGTVRGGRKRGRQKKEGKTTSQNGLE